VIDGRAWLPESGADEAEVFQGGLDRLEEGGVSLNGLVGQLFEGGFQAATEFEAGGLAEHPAAPLDGVGEAMKLLQLGGTGVATGGAEAVEGLTQARQAVAQLGLEGGQQTRVGGAHSR
jgi:hypothetical protein